jgi:hypothetical protein
MHALESERKVRAKHQETTTTKAAAAVAPARWAKKKKRGWSLSVTPSSALSLSSQFSSPFPSLPVNRYTAEMQCDRERQQGNAQRQ